MDGAFWLHTETKVRLFGFLLLPFGKHFRERIVGLPRFCVHPVEMLVFI